METVKPKKVVWLRWYMYPVYIFLFLFIVGLIGVLTESPEASKARLEEQKIEDEKERIQDSIETVQKKLRDSIEYEKQLKENRKEIIESKFSEYDGSHVNFTNYIKDNMNDPDSYEHIQTSYRDMKDFLIVTTQFRGNNAFGGKVKNTLSAKVDLKGNIIEILK